MMPSQAFFTLLKRGSEIFDIGELHDAFAALPGVLLVAGTYSFGYIFNEAIQGRAWLTAD